MTNRVIPKAASLLVLFATTPMLGGCVDYRASLAFASKPTPVQPVPGALSINDRQTVLVCDGVSRSELNRCRQLDLSRVREMLQDVHRDYGY